MQRVCGARRPIVPRPSVCPDPYPDSVVPPTATDSGRVRITTIARLYFTKGLDHLLEAIALVRRTHPGAEFRVHGAGELRADLLRRAEELELDGEAIFVGAFEHADLPRIMRQSDMWVSSSILEGQSLALVEAMAYGLPIAATAAGGTAELIEHRVNGMLCAPSDPVALAENITALIESRELRETLGRAARETYERSPFQPHAAAEIIRRVYLDAVHDSGAPRAKS